MTAPGKGPAGYFPAIEEKYGRSIAQVKHLIRSSPLTRHMELVAWLRSEHGLGHGHANALVPVATNNRLDQELTADATPPERAQTSGGAPDVRLFVLHGRRLHRDQSVLEIGVAQTADGVQQFHPHQDEQRPVDEEGGRRPERKRPCAVFGPDDARGDLGRDHVKTSSRASDGTSASLVSASTEGRTRLGIPRTLPDGPGSAPLQLGDEPQVHAGRGRLFPALLSLRSDELGLWQWRCLMRFRGIDPSTDPPTGEARLHRVSGCEPNRCRPQRVRLVVRRVIGPRPRTG